MTNGTRLTPTHKKMLALLSDGLPHSKQELYCCLWDDQSAINTIAYHISTLRKKPPPGQAIVCEFTKRAMHYRLVELVGAARDR